MNKGCFLLLMPSTAFADGGISGALGFIDSLVLVLLITSVIIHAIFVYFLGKKQAFKRSELVAASLFFSSLTIMFWLIQFLNNIANRLYYSWPNYHGGILLPVILITLTVVIIWTVKVPLRQYIHSNDHTDD